jgi:hypothetical protein
MECGNRAGRCKWLGQWQYSFGNYSLNSWIPTCMYNSAVWLGKNLKLGLVWWWLIVVSDPGLLRLSSFNLLVKRRLISCFPNRCIEGARWCWKRKIDGNDRRIRSKEQHQGGVALFPDGKGRKNVIHKGPDYLDPTHGIGATLVSR